MNFLTAFVEIKVDFSKLRTDLAKASSLVTRTVTKMRSGLNKMGSLFMGMYRKVARYAKYAALAIIGMTVASVKAFASFETQLANISTMLDKNTMKYMTEYQEELKKIAMEFGESTATLSKGLYDILSASISASKALKVLKVSAKAAKAGLTTTAVAADAITTILNSYGLAAEEASRISDILFATVKRGKLTFAELAPNIGKVAAIAATAGLSFEELSAAIATITRAGLDADLATTSLRAVINMFLKPADEAAEMAQKFGFELNSATLSALGLTGVLEKLSEATADELSILMPNIRGLAGFAAALRQTTGIANDLKLMLNSLGLTQEAYDKMTKTLTHTLNRFWQAVTVTAVEIGEVLAPTIEKAGKNMIFWLKGNKKAVAEWVKGLVDATKKGQPFRDYIDGVVITLKAMHKLFISLAATGKSIGDLADPKVRKQRMQQTFGGSWGNWGMDLDRGLDDNFIRDTLEKTVIGSGIKFGRHMEEAQNQFLSGPRMTPKDYQKLAEENARKRVEAEAKAIQEALASMTSGPLSEQWQMEIDLAGQKNKKIASDSIETSKRMFTIKMAQIQAFNEQHRRIAEDYAVAMANSWADAFDQMTFEGKKFGEAMTDMFRGLLRQIASIMMYKKIAEPIAYGIMGIPLPGVVPDYPTGTGTGGNIVAAGSGNVVGLHSGGYVEKTGWAKVHQGETYSGVGKGLSNDVTVNIVNQTDNQNMSAESDVEYDIDGMIVNVLLNDEKNNGQFTQMLDSKYRKG